MGNSWSTPKKKGGGYYSEHPKHGNLSSGYTEKNGKRVPSENHVHRHKDGVTVTLFITNSSLPAGSLPPGFPPFPNYPFEVFFVRPRIHLEELFIYLESAWVSDNFARVQQTATKFDSYWAYRLKRKPLPVQLEAVFS